GARRTRARPTGRSSGGVARRHTDISIVSGLIDNGGQHPVEHTKQYGATGPRRHKTHNNSGKVAASGSMSLTRK
ncbi:hypothetical protein, partial [Burkholderia sp.]|uniref:hypothetical protein n=1 Tax=Burkholderia sp. TaxID=36773 RepID=UPI0025826FFE